MPAAWHSMSTLPKPPSAVPTIRPAPLVVGDGVEARQGFPARCPDLVYDSRCRAARLSGAVHGPAEVVDDYGGALLRQKQCHTSPDAAARSCNDSHSAL